MSLIKIAIGSGAALLLSLTVTSCSSSGGGGAQTTSAGAPQSTSRASAPASQSAPDTSSNSSSNSSAGSLSGKWAGSYNGAFTGTFTLNWTQDGSKLTGTIDLSTGGRTPLNGTVTNGQISFGTVGSTVITYTGSVSGDTMSGHYQVAGGAAGSGSWNAHRS